MTTFAPCRARSSAVARPTPTAEPVTIAVFPRTSIVQPPGNGRSVPRPCDAVLREGAFSQYERREASLERSVHSPRGFETQGAGARRRQREQAATAHVYGREAARAHRQQTDTVLRHRAARRSGD